MRGRRIDEVDKVVGRNVRVYRLARGMSQSDLGSQLELTFQQIQKYEKGANRIGSGRLLKISRALDVPISAFYEGSGDGEAPAQDSVYDQLAEPQSFRLLKAFSGIVDTKMRRSVVDLVERIAGEK